MITNKKLLSILRDWKGRYDKYAPQQDKYSLGYRDALSECTDDMKKADGLQDTFIKETPPEEIEEYIRQQDADSWLATAEAHDQNIIRQ